MKNWKILGLTVTIVILLSLPAKAQFAVIDVTNLAQNIVQVSKAITQIQNQIAQLDAMYQNLQRIAQPNWRDLGPYLQQLNNIAQQGDALGYSIENLFSAFRAQMPGFTPMQADRFEDFYEQWTDVTLDTLAASLDTVSYQAEQYFDSQEQLFDLQGISNISGGNLEALNTSNMFLSHIAQETAKLNQLLAATINGQNVYFGMQMNLEASHEATERWLIDESVEPFHVYTGEGGFTGIPSNWPFGCLGCGG